MAYVYLALAIIAEVIATSALKASQEFTRLWPSLVVIAGYGIALFKMGVLLFNLVPYFALRIIG